MSASRPEHILVRHPSVVKSAENAGPDSRQLTGERGSADADMATIIIPSADSRIPQDHAWTPKAIQDYVDSQITNRVNNTFDPSVNVPGIGAWSGFLTWPNDKWDEAIQGLYYPGGVDPFVPDRLYNPDPGHPEKWGDAFLGIRLPVSKGPLTWDDVYHIRNMIVPDPKAPPTLRYRRVKEAKGGRHRKSRKAKKLAHKSRKHRKSKKNMRRHRRTKRRRTRR